jgi:hypothetical protein
VPRQPQKVSEEIVAQVILQIARDPDHDPSHEKEKYSLEHREQDDETR